MMFNIANTVRHMNTCRISLLLVQGDELTKNRNIRSKGIF